MIDVIELIKLAKIEAKIELKIVALAEIFETIETEYVANKLSELTELLIRWKKLKIEIEAEIDNE